MFTDCSGVLYLSIPNKTVDDVLRFASEFSFPETDHGVAITCSDGVIIISKQGGYY